ncbi:MAG: aminotransferase class I/II-fold pyridoxal phosphate-dependent enzyme [Clostridiales bacterium]|nr:aminotransferase class I/II-fold pyridoxal phosphate-dependent enzyme [Clostridiales bacterium]
MLNLKIYKTLKNFDNSRPLRFGMPGHKGNATFCKRFGGANLDVTELTALNLEKVVGDAEFDIADILRAKYAKILTNGSTAGIQCMLHAVKNRGKEIIINRTAHKSVYNALKLCGISPIVADFGFDYGLPNNPTTASTEKLLDTHPKAIGVLYTYPDYFGRTFDIKKISAVLKKRNKLLLIDGAHGGHYAYTDDKPYAGDYADIWVDGVHKTLPALNQGAVLLCSNAELIPSLEKAVDIFCTTSPSYPIMASVEYAVKFMNERGRQEIERVSDSLAELKFKIARSGVTFMEKTDALKLAVDFGSAGICTDTAEKLLIKKGIHAELNDGRYLLFMFSALTKKSEINALARAIVWIAKTVKRTEVFEGKTYSIPERKMPYLLAVSSAVEEVPLSNAVGQIAGENAGLFPPCYPVVTAGEVITDDVIKVLSATNVFGVKNGKIKIVKG